MFAAAATRGDVTVLNVIPKHLDATISKLIDIGCEVEEFDDAVRVVRKALNISRRSEQEIIMKRRQDCIRIFA